MGYKQERILFLPIMASNCGKFNPPLLSLNNIPSRFHKSRSLIKIVWFSVLRLHEGLIFFRCDHGFVIRKKNISNFKRCLGLECYDSTIYFNMYKWMD